MNICCSGCGQAVRAVKEILDAGRAVTCADCQALAIASNPDIEFDHRGVRLPARTRVGGIIIPQ
jgi:hypothetical protein